MGQCREAREDVVVSIQKCHTDVCGHVNHFPVSICHGCYTDVWGGIGARRRLRQFLNYRTRLSINIVLLKLVLLKLGFASRWRRPSKLALDVWFHPLAMGHGAKRRRPAVVAATSIFLFGSQAVVDNILSAFMPTGGYMGF